jgi:uncharacterized protein (TIGR03083 family)
MADFAQHLPLSQRARVDESGIESTWAPHIATTLTAIADLLESLTAEEWNAPSLRGGWRVRDVVGHLVWRLGSSRWELITSTARAAVPRFGNLGRAVDALSREAAEAQPAELIRSVRRIAAAKTERRTRGGIAELTEAVVGGLDIAHPLGRTLPIDPLASGAVAVRRSLLAPADVRGVLRARTLVAADAGWRVGRGPVIRGTAEAHILFLFGRTPLQVAPEPRAVDAG